jgi:plasmid stabilization system protein ParE
MRSDLKGSPRAYVGAWPYIVLCDPVPKGIFVLRVLDGRRDVPKQFHAK